LFFLQQNHPRKDCAGMEGEAGKRANLKKSVSIAHA